MDLSINTVDLIIIVVYLVGILLLGILSVRLRKMDSEGYFLAGKAVHGFARLSGESSCGKQRGDA